MRRTMNRKRLLKTRSKVPAMSTKPFGSPFREGKRDRGAHGRGYGFVPPEDWYEPTNDRNGYRFVVQAPGDGYQHVVTMAEIRERLSQLPREFVGPLEVVQLSRMTLKKQTFPCYGMQWGAAIYLYPIEEGLIEYFPQPPRPQQFTEAKMYGGRWVQEGARWRLEWSEAAIRDFYLNNVLIHELGHLLDQRNAGYTDRERYAEWFAVRYGYQTTAGSRRGRRQKVVRRHHSV